MNIYVNEIRQLAIFTGEEEFKKKKKVKLAFMAGFLCHISR